MVDDHDRCVGEYFFWYRLTQVVLEKGCKMIVVVACRVKSKIKLKLKNYFCFCFISVVTATVKEVKG